ncbi:hypothetical protein MRB53_007592 [Persea americana]|uniref:Uncharacterized protein n=1 Tax=Persea americana TaxID=3435 RepID=A0ACC2MJM6_PERAE|nr:hypothetical protein MRB53_007592 [Persea americana]
MASSSSAKTTISNAKFEVEKFDGTNNFGMWQCEIRDVLSQQELEIALEDKPSDMKDEEWKKINLMIIFTYTLINEKTEVKYNVVSAALMNNEYRKKDKQAHKDSSSDALTVKGRSDDRKSHSKSRGKSKPPAKDECAFCHKKGHWKEDFPKLKNKDKDKSVANIGHNGDNDSGFSLTVFSLNKQNGSQDESKASGKLKQEEFDVIPIKSDGDYTNEEETPVDVIPVE